ncbi:hypothetical protein [Nitrospira sp. Kam-Ns4a]
MYAVMTLLGLMLLTWAAAIWATFMDEPEGQASDAGRTTLRKAV